MKIFKLLVFFLCQHTKKVFIKGEYIDEAIEKSYDAFKYNVEDYFYQSVTISAIKWSCFSVALLIAYIVIFRPFLTQLKEEIWLTEGMLNLIPTKLLLENTDLRKILFKK